MQRRTLLRRDIQRAPEPAVQPKHPPKMRKSPRTCLWSGVFFVGGGAVEDRVLCPGRSPRKKVRFVAVSGQYDRTQFCMTVEMVCGTIQKTTHAALEFSGLSVQVPSLRGVVLGDPRVLLHRPFICSTSILAWKKYCQKKTDTGKLLSKTYEVLLAIEPLESWVLTTVAVFGKSVLEVSHRVHVEH